jgi:hypothetical protein
MPRWEKTQTRGTVGTDHAGGPEEDEIVVKRPLCAASFLFACFGGGALLRGDFVPVRYPEGVVRGFLVLRAPDGSILADGNLFQTSRGDRVTSRLEFRFRDGSLQDETAVFTQRGKFRLVSDRLVQRGPSFPRPMELSIDAASGRVTVKSAEKGKEKFLDERMDLPPDLANGLVSTLLKELAPNVASTTLSMVVAAPKPRLVKLAVTRAGIEPLSAGRLSYRAIRFNVKVELGGLAGVVAPLVGKQPKDATVWIVGGEAPGFVRSESQFYEGAPLWTIELAAPEYRRTPAGRVP